MTPAELETIRLSLIVTASFITAVAGLVAPWYIWGLSIERKGKQL